MSENLDLVRSLFAAWERGDFSSAHWAHPLIEFAVADGPAPVSSKGVVGMAENWRDHLSAWEEVRPVAEEYRELGDDRVLVLIRNRGRGRGSGISVEGMARSASLFHISNGKVTRLVIYMARESALADLGLAAEGGSP